MTSVLLLALALTPGTDHLSASLGPLVMPAGAPDGYTYSPARDLSRVTHYPARRYDPQAANIILMSDATLLSRTLYALAMSGAPDHIGIAFRQPNGRIGMLETGFSESLCTRFAPLDYRIHHYPGVVWVRRVRVPVTPDQDQRLTAFAALVDDTRYNLRAVKLNITPFRSRDPLRTAALARPAGGERSLYCSEAVLEVLVCAGLIEPETTRPKATFPRDLFFDRSPNLYINRHSPLSALWDALAL